MSTETLIIFPTAARATAERHNLPEGVEVCCYDDLMGYRGDLIIFVRPQAGLDSPRARQALVATAKILKPNGRIIHV